MSKIMRLPREAVFCSGKFRKCCSTLYYKFSKTPTGMFGRLDSTHKFRTSSLENVTKKIRGAFLSGQTHEFIVYAMRQRARTDNLTICCGKKQIDVSFSCVCPVIDHEIRHNIVKIVCGSTRLSPSYFDNVMMKFMISNRTDAGKTDLNLLTWNAAHAQALPRESNTLSLPYCTKCCSTIIECNLGK